MRTLLRFAVLPFALLVLEGSASAQTEAESPSSMEPEQLVAQARAKLAAIGYDVPESVRLETRTKEQVLADLDAQQDLFLPADAFALQHALLSRLRLSAGRTPKDVHARGSPSSPRPIRSAASSNTWGSPLAHRRSALPPPRSSGFPEQRGGEERGARLRLLLAGACRASASPAARARRTVAASGSAASRSSSSCHRGAAHHVDEDGEPCESAAGTSYAAAANLARRSEPFRSTACGHYVGETDLFASADRVRRCFAPSVFERLSALREKWDPEEIFAGFR
jgi:hypothetical protein